MTPLHELEIRTDKSALPILNGDEIERYLAELGEDWHVDTSEAPMLWRDFETEDFSTAIMLLNSVADVAEEANHHPDLFLHDYSGLTITLTTHTLGALTLNDFIVAARINQLLEDEEAE